jgi:hypothetical protein
VRNLTCALAAATDTNHDNGRRRSNNVNDCEALSSPTNAAEEICTLLSHTLTNIPILLVQLVSTRPYPIVEWESDSLALEDATWPHGVHVSRHWDRQVTHSVWEREGDARDIWALCLSYTKFSLGTVSLLHFGQRLPSPPHESDKMSSGGGDEFKCVSF